MSSKNAELMIEVPVAIPTLDGKGVAETVMVKVPCTVDPVTGEQLLDGDALAELDRVKARHMGLLQPEQIHQMRVDLGLTQKDISELLQLGAKSYTRWESGNERPSRSMNILLRGIADGKLTVDYLRSLRGPRLERQWSHKPHA